MLIKELCCQYGHFKASTSTCIHSCGDAIKKITHFEIFFQSAFNLGPTRATRFEIFFQNACTSTLFMI